MKRRGMVAPVLAVGDGALGFWAAAREVCFKTREQGCRCHKFSNVLDKLFRQLHHRTSIKPDIPWWRSRSVTNWERLVSFFDFLIDCLGSVTASTPCARSSLAPLAPCVPTRADAEAL
jgi:hypothetical protein